MKRDKGYSKTYEEALRLAAVAHRHQMRKGSGLPYVIHPIHVSVILLRYGFSTEVAVAALLHDVVEDQDYDLAEISEQFGPRVAEVVEALSERKHNDRGEKRAWTLRKQEALERMEVASREAVAVRAADALHNARSFSEDLLREGAHMWRHFNQGAEPQLDYYRRIVAICKTRLGPHPLVYELAGAVEDLARAVRKTSRQGES
jgi:(p)ppGpp synthase/HD superfamily hydrolase